MWVEEACKDPLGFSYVMVGCFMIYILHLRASLVFPIEVGMSSMEGEMYVVGGDLIPIEVELDDASYAWRPSKFF